MVMSDLHVEWLISRVILREIGAIAIGRSFGRAHVRMT